jgi:RND family efflux transporter MFP subunit
MAVKYQTQGRYAARTRNLAIVALLLGGCSSREAPAGPPRPHVSVANPIVREVIDWDDYVGRFEAVQDVTVMPRVSGTITEIMFRNGIDVKAGQPLFIIDPRPFRAIYLQTVADLSKARATQTNASTVSARAQKLVDAQILSREDYENRLAALHAADADVDAKTAAVEAARLNLEFTTVAAPLTGRVSDRRVSVGDTVVANTTPLTRVVTLDPIWFDFEGAESFYLKYVRQDQSGERRSSRYAPNPVEVQLADETGYPHKGRMVFVDNAIDTHSGTIRAQAELPNPDGFLTPGMFGRARLLGSGAYKAMLIPDEAIVTDQTRRLVYVVGEDGAVAPRIVETGPLVVGLRVVRTGSAPMDRVVLDGLARLQPGARVETTLVKLEPRAEDTSPTSTPLSAPPSAEATPR